MVALPEEPIRMTVSEYLELERQSTHGGQREAKYEFIDGYVVAMSDASREHNLICANLIAILVRELRGKDCEVYPSDMRVKISDTKYTYPDVSVVCGQPQFTDNAFDNLLNPDLIIEVLSPTTEAYDRGEKFRSYRKLASLKHYLLISQHKPQIDYYHISESGAWMLADIGGFDSTLTLANMNLTLALNEIYERITF